MPDQPALFSEEKEKLRALFSANAQQVYQRALTSTGSPERAKQVLSRVFQDAARTPALCLCREGYLLELCDSICRQTRPIEEILNTPASAPSPKAPCDTRRSPVAETEAAAPCEPAPSVRRIEPARGTISPEYDLEQDEWIRELREQRRRAKQHPPASCPVDTATPAKHVVPAAVSGSEDLGILEEFEPPKRRIFAKLGITVLCVIIVLLLWSILGLLMNLEILPWVDLGYSWFNTHLFDMF